MQRYDTYKDSGVKWLGEIPSHWEVKRLASYFTERRVKVSDKEYEPLSVTKLGVFPQWENVAKTNDGDNRKLVKEGDFVINSRSDRKGSSGVADRDGSVSLINIVLKPRNTIRADFSNYLLKSYKFIEEYYRNGRGIVADLWTTRYDEMKMIKLAIPPLKEQESIANYLDCVTAKIDAAIAQQQKMIDLLNERKQIIINNAVTHGLNPNVKMKDSGVEWIGEVPEGWEVKKLGYCIDILPGYAFPSQDFVENGIKLLRGINVSPEKIRWEESVYWNKTIDDTLKKYMLEVNDLVLGLDRPWIGSGTRVAIVKKEDLPCLLVQRVCRIRPTNMMSINYIYYFLSNNLFYNALAVDTTGVSVPHISTEQIKKVVIPIPKLSEQNAIVEYIEMHIASINKAIQAANNQISLLQERKQIIINEVVTGKVKVV